MTALKKAKAGLLNNKKRAALIGAAVFVVVAALIAALAVHAGGDGKTEYTTAEVEAVTMEQTLTAAGEIKAASEEKIEFGTSSTFKGMCVEEGDAVSKGQHLIEYSNGTFTDAPGDGVITEINAPKTGNTAGDSNTLTLAHTNKMILEISVPEDDINTVSRGDNAEIVTNADTSKTYEGTIKSIKAISSDMLSEEEEAEDDASDDSNEDKSNTSDAGKSNTSGSDRSSSSGFGSSSNSTANYVVAILLKNDDTLKPGMSANCTIRISSRKSVLAVPVEAVLFDEDDTAYVNLVDGEKVTRKDVTIGESDAFNVEISEGLNAGDVVQIETHR